MKHDMIANMITCICNANLSKIKIVEVAATRATRDIATILLQEGLIESLRERQDCETRLLVLTLRYQRTKRVPYITTIRRISKPGGRVYCSYQHIPKVLNGMGIVILSTSQGIMVDREARHKKLGGEVVCYIW
jgi:small subunit ribosomal protein S8